jgi:sugar/nucleoside kinase (ribokinase family)
VEEGVESRQRVLDAHGSVILCAGIIVLDEVFRVERFPEPDTKAAAQSFFVVNGGCAANAAVAVARLGGRATLAGPLGGPAGEDSNGDYVLAALAREGVDCSGCPRVAGVPTALSAILIDARGDRVIVTYRHEQLEGVVPADPAGLLASVDAVLVDNRFPNFVRPLCQAARERGLPVVLDADRPTQMSDDLFRIATHVVFSSECLRATTGLDDPAVALRPHVGPHPIISRRHSGRAGRALARWGDPAPKPRIRGAGGRHAGCWRCVPRRFRARTC